MIAIVSWIIVPIAGHKSGNLLAGKLVGVTEMQLYRLLSGPDDAEFCARVEKQLNRGWSLHGSPAATFNGDRVIVVQAIVREKEGQYGGFVHLDQLDG